jgi:hypothetical protein
VPVTNEGRIDPMGIVWENRGEDEVTGILPDGSRVTPPEVLKRGDIIVLPRRLEPWDPDALWIITDVSPDGAVGYNPYYAGGLTWTETPWGTDVRDLQDCGIRRATAREREQGTADPSSAR